MYSTLGDLSYSRTDLERQAEAHELLRQGQENYPTFQPYNPIYQPGHAGPGFTNQQPFDGYFSPEGPAHDSLSSPYPQPPCSDIRLDLFLNVYNTFYVIISLCIRKPMNIIGTEGEHIVFHSV